MAIYVTMLHTGPLTDSTTLILYLCQSEIPHIKLQLVEMLHDLQGHSVCTWCKTRGPLHKHCYISKSIVVNALSAASLHMTQRNYLYDKQLVDKHICDQPCRYRQHKYNSGQEADYSSLYNATRYCRMPGFRPLQSPAIIIWMLYSSSSNFSPAHDDQLYMLQRSNYCFPLKSYQLVELILFYFYISLQHFVSFKPSAFDMGKVF